MAPCFDPKNPSTLCMYISDYESLAEVVQLTLGECLAQSMHYLTKEDKDDWAISWNLKLPFQTGTHSKRLSSGVSRFQETVYIS